MPAEVNYGAIDPMAVYKGAAATNALLQGWAKQRAGKALAKGDQEGAMATLNSEGMMDEARTVEQTGQRNTIFHNAQDDRLTAQDDKKKAESVKFIHDVSMAIGQVVASDGPQAAVPAFDQLVPIFEQRGAKPEEIATYRAQLAQNPQRFVMAMVEKTKAEMDNWQGLTGTGGVYALNKATGESKTISETPQTKIVPQGSDLVTVPHSTTAAPEAPAAPGHPDPHISRTPEAMEYALLDIVPGAKVTSRGRTPEHNEEVGGAKHSWHLSDQARDFVPPPGVTLDQVRAQLTARGLPVTELLDEGDHFHWAWGEKGVKQPAAPGGAGQSQVLHSNPKPVAERRNLTAEELTAKGYPAGSVVQTDGLGKETVTYKPTGAGAGGGGAVKLSPQTEIFITKARTSANEATNMSNLVDQFLALNKKVDTGGMLAAPGAGAMLGPFNKDISRMTSIANQLTPAMRNGLPGAASDRDVSMFRAATVGIDKPRAANQAIGTAAKAFASRQNDYVAFMENWAKNNGSLLGAQESWTDYVTKNPLFVKGGPAGLKPTAYTPWRSYFAKGTNTAPAQASPSSPTAPGSGRRRVFVPGQGLVG